MNSINSLPSAKMKKGDRVGVHAWTSFHAAFSERFVGAAISALGVSPKDTVLDPFVGSGTTIIGARRAGVKAIGIDLDPFACLLARAKVAECAEKKL